MRDYSRWEQKDLVAEVERLDRVRSQNYLAAAYFRIVLIIVCATILVWVALVYGRI